MINYDIPNSFIQERFQFFPAYLQNHVHNYYANLDEPITDTDFADWTVGLFQINSATEVENLGSPIKDIISGSAYRFYFQFTITASVTGLHYLVVYNSTDDTVKFVTNPFYVITDADVPEWIHLQYRNSTNFDNYNYSLLPQHNNIFIPASLIENGFEYGLKNVDDLTTNQVRQQSFRRKKTITIETEFFDEYANDMMASLSGHNDIIINGEPVTVKEGHTRDNNRDFNLNSGRITFYVKRYSAVNYN